jgi:hypothetical protein
MVPFGLTRGEEIAPVFCLGNERRVISINAVRIHVSIERLIAITRDAGDDGRPRSKACSELLETGSRFTCGEVCCGCIGHGGCSDVDAATLPCVTDVASVKLREVTFFANHQPVDIGDG